MKRKINFIAIFIFSLIFIYGQPREIPELGKLFSENNVTSSILVFDLKTKEYKGYDLDRYNTGFAPASTFTLIALETKTITFDSIFRWNGEKRRLEQWNSDMNISEAFKKPNLPIYREIAKSTGVNMMNKYIKLFNYGNMNINYDNIDNFWLEKTSTISQFQQIYFLEKLYNLELPLKKATMNSVKEIMFIEKIKNFKISGKTGWNEDNGKDIG